MSKTKKNISSLLLFTFILVLFSTCVDPFTPDLTDLPEDNELVVQGFITDTDQPNVIRLSRTVPVIVGPQIGGNDIDAPPETGAILRVIDQIGTPHFLTETEPGMYVTNPLEFRAEVGNAYQLRIELTNGEVFESDFQELLPVEPIDSIWVERGTIEREQAGFFREFPVVKFFTNYDTHEEPAYYRYEFLATYQFTSELQGNPVCWRNPGEIPTPLRNNTVCYLNDTVNLPLNVSVYPDPVEGDRGFDEIFNTPFDIRFRLGTSVLVKKYNLTKEYHDYLASISEQREFGGSIFDSPPTQVLGNIRNLNDPRRFALGYFSTLAETTKRVFIPSLGADRLEGRCAFNPSATPPDDIPKFLDCCDCLSNSGATDVRPDFWGN